MSAGITPRQLLALAQELNEILPPDTRIVRNLVGNIAWTYPDESTAWADLGTGEVHLPDQDAYEPGARAKDRPMTRDEHLKKIYVTGSRTVNKAAVLMMLCSGPDCAGAQMLTAGLTAADVAAEASAHVDKMAELGV